MWKDIFFKCRMCQNEYRVRLFSQDEKCLLYPCACGVGIDPDKEAISAETYNSSGFDKLAVRGEANETSQMERH